MRLVLERLAPRTVRDEDVRLLIVFYDAIGAHVFTTRDVFERCRLTDDALLRSALAAAFVDSPKALGWWARRMAGQTIEGLCLQRKDDRRAGAVWQITRVV